MARLAIVTMSALVFSCASKHFGCLPRCGYRDPSLRVCRDRAYPMPIANSTSSRFLLGTRRRRVFRFSSVDRQSINTGCSKVYNRSSMRDGSSYSLALLLLALAVPGTPADPNHIANGALGRRVFLVGTAMAHLLSSTFPGRPRRRAATVPAHSLEIIHRGKRTIGLVGLASAYFGVRAT